jgi:hypothetical protein
MKDLKQYVENKNRWNLIFNNPCYDLESAADRQRIAEALDADLSPENLTCDGELPRAQVLTRLTFLNKAVAQLLELDPDCSVYIY